MTATHRVAFHRYTFPENNQPAGVVIDLEHGIGWDSPVEGHLEWDGDRSVRGYRISSCWSRHQEIYFMAVFSVPVLDVELFEGTTPVAGSSLTTRKTYARVWLDVPVNGEVLVKVALSPESMEKARATWNTNCPDGISKHR